VHHAIRATLLGTTFVLSACYRSVLVPLPVQPGAPVQVTLVGPTAVTVHTSGNDSALRFERVTSLHGRTRASPSDSLVMNLGYIQLAGYGVVSRTGDEVAIPASVVARVTTQRFDAKRTLMGPVALVLYVTLCIGAMALTGGGPGGM
jgi:hypothetical protein